MKKLLGNLATNQQMVGWCKCIIVYSDSRKKHVMSCVFRVPYTIARASSQGGEKRGGGQEGG